MSSSVTVRTVFSNYIEATRKDYMVNMALLPFTK